VTQFLCTCIRQTPISESIFRITCETSSPIRVFKPGQFIQLRTSSGYDPLLRRPFSIHRFNKENNTFDILYRVLGKGTQWLLKVKEGTVLDAIGPLGNNFKINDDFTHAFIIVGGMGCAPVFFLINELLKLKKHVTLLWGARIKNEIFDIELLQDSGVDVQIATEDGSLGHHGLVTDLLQSCLETIDDGKHTRGFTCGPVGMLRNVQSLVSDTSFNWQVSVEERMACGVGVCLGCAMQMKSGGYKMTCTHGPVLDLREVLFNE